MLRLSDIMTADVVTVSPELTLREAMDLFVARHISGAPVVEGERVLGVVSLIDLVALAAALPGVPTERGEPADFEALEEPELEDAGDEPPASFFTEMWDDVGADVVARAEASGAPEWNVLEEHTVSEAMNQEICSLPADADIPQAAEHMQRLGIHRLLVMDGDRLLGILTTTDIARAVAQRQLSERRFIFGKPQVRPDGSWW